MSKRLKIATWNVNGIRARGAQVHEWLLRERPDVVCLQETKAPADKVPAELRELPDYWGFWHGFKGYSGVALLVHKEFAPNEPQFFHPAFDVENRVVVATIDGLTVASIYLPNGGRDFEAKLRFAYALRDFARDRAGEQIILCGDLNIAHTPMDVHPKERGEYTGQLPIERELFDQILAHGLVDLGRALAPNDEGLFTWWAPWRQMRQRNIGWRLDYLLMSRSLAERAEECHVEREVGTSDHAPVVATLVL